MLISPAYAQSAPTVGGFDVMSVLPLVLIFIVFYFLLLRPQQKRAKEHKAMIEAVRRGDTITTSGGIIGKVTKVNDDGTLQVEIAENVRIRVVKSTVMEVRSKGEPADGASDSDEKNSAAAKMKK